MYVALLRYVLPLCMLGVSVDLSDVLLNAGLMLDGGNATPSAPPVPNTTLAPGPSSSGGASGRVDLQISKLAAFGAAHRVLKFLRSGSWEMRAVGIRLVRTRRDYGVALAFALAQAGACVGLMVLFAVTPAGRAVTGLRGEAGDLLALALFSLCALPAVCAVDRLHEGILLKQKKTAWVGASGAVDWVGQFAIIAAFAAGVRGVDPAATRSNPMVAPVVALYVGAVCKLGVVLMGLVCQMEKCPHWKSNCCWCSRGGSGGDHDGDGKAAEEEEKEEEKEEKDHGGSDSKIMSPTDENENHRHGAVPAATITFRKVLQMWWPLASVKAFQGISRPLMNLLVAQSAAAETGVAVLTLSFPLGHLPYGPLNHLKGIAAAFMDLPGSLAYVKRFIPMCVAFSFFFGLVFLWPPADSGFGALALLSTLGASASLVSACAVPLRIFAFFCLAVGLRNFKTAMCVVEKRTWPLAFTGPIRVAVMCIMGWGVLHAGAGLEGGVLGIAALFSGFCAEALSCYLCVKFCGGSTAAKTAVDAIVPRSEIKMVDVAKTSSREAGAHLRPLQNVQKEGFLVF